MLEMLKRFKKIMEANVNAILEKAENPVYMAEQLMIDLQRDLAKVKAETAQVMANESKAKRDIEKLDNDAEALKKYAEKALLAGNEDDARAFLAEQQVLSAKKDPLMQAYVIAQENSQKMRQMHDKLESDIKILHERKDVIISKAAVAKAQERMNKLTDKVVTGSNNIENATKTFDKYEAKIDRKLDVANAVAELNHDTDDMRKLKEKYSAPEISDKRIDEEIANMKLALGL